METKTIEYLREVAEMRDDDLFCELNLVIRRQQVLHESYNRLNKIIDSQCIKLRFFNSYYKRATDLRRKVCSEINPLIDITNHFYGLLNKRGLKYEEGMVSWKSDYKIDFLFSNPCPNY